jgi:hypothetical protein
MCHQHITDYTTFELGRLGQVRSPFHIDYTDDYEKQGKVLTFGIDGEFYELRKCTRITFSLDKTCPKLKILKRKGYVHPNVAKREMLSEMKEEFSTPLF